MPLCLGACFGGRRGAQQYLEQAEKESSQSSPHTPQGVLCTVARNGSSNCGISPARSESGVVSKERSNRMATHQSTNSSPTAPNSTRGQHGHDLVYKRHALPLAAPCNVQTDGDTESASTSGRASTATTAAGGQCGGETGKLPVTTRTSTSTGMGNGNSSSYDPQQQQQQQQCPAIGANDCASTPELSVARCGGGDGYGSRTYARSQSQASNLDNSSINNNNTAPLTHSHNNGSQSSVCNSKQRLLLISAAHHARVSQGSQLPSPGPSSPYYSTAYYQSGSKAFVRGTYSESTSQQAPLSQWQEEGLELQQHEDNTTGLLVPTSSDLFSVAKCDGDSAGQTSLMLSAGGRVRRPVKSSASCGARELVTMQAQLPAHRLSNEHNSSNAHSSDLPSLQKCSGAGGAARVSSGMPAMMMAQQMSPASARRASASSVRTPSALGLRSSGVIPLISEHGPDPLSGTNSSHLHSAVSGVMPAHGHNYADISIDAASDAAPVSQPIGAITIGRKAPARRASENWLGRAVAAAAGTFVGKSPLKATAAALFGGRTGPDAAHKPQKRVSLASPVMGMKPEAGKPQTQEQPSMMMGAPAAFVSMTDAAPRAASGQQPQLLKAHSSARDSSCMHLHSMGSSSMAITTMNMASDAGITTANTTALLTTMNTPTALVTAASTASSLATSACETPSTGAASRLASAMLNTSNKKAGELQAPPPPADNNVARAGAARSSPSPTASAGAAHAATAPLSARINKPEDVDSQNKQPQVMSGARNTSSRPSPTSAALLRPLTPQQPQQPAASPRLLSPAVERLMALPPGSVLHISRALPAGMDRRGGRTGGTWSLGQFYKDRKLYQGYSSHVYKATCALSDQSVVLKVYDLAVLSPFLAYQVFREVEVHGRISHPNAVHLYAAFREGQFVVLVQEYARGGNLARVLNKLGARLPPAKACDMVLRPLLRVLDYLHSQGIVHRDIKPDNILFTEHWQLKLADFGVAVDMTTERPVTRTGTPAYFAPEVKVCPLKRTAACNKDNANIAYGPSVDIYSLGVLAYEVMVGMQPCHTYAKVTHSSSVKASGEKQQEGDAAGAAPGGGGGGSGGGFVSGGRQLQLAFPGYVDSPAARDLVCACLRYSAADRPTARQLVRHPFLAPPAMPAAASPTAVGSSTGDSSAVQVASSCAAGTPGSANLAVVPDGMAAGKEAGSAISRARQAAC